MSINSNILNRILFLFLVLVIVFNLSSIVFSHSANFLSQDFWKRFPSLKLTYLNSQYVNKHSKGWIPDETVNAYAGGAYIKGIPPILIAPDTPPFGRYLIGLSATLFNNENLIILLSAIISLIFLYLLGVQIFSNRTLALIAPALFSFEPIFKNQLIYTPLLDIIQLWEILGCFYFFNKGITSKKNTVVNFIIANVLLGFFISTKFFATGLTIIFSSIIVLFFLKNVKKLKVIFLMIPIAPIILLLSYVKVFSLGYSFKAFLGIQKWVFLYHKSQLILPFSIWPLLFLNKWYVWYGSKSVISDSQWQITWPIVGVITIITIALYFLKKIPQKKELNVLIVWTILYILFFSFGQITSRYLIIYLPILYLISIYGLKYIILKIAKRFRSK